MRRFLPNPFDQMLRKCRGDQILLAWNRGLGDIPLGLYAMVLRIREIIPHADITFLIRENLKEGFSLLEGVKILVAPDWKRKEPYCVESTLKKLSIDPNQYDLVIRWPNPTEWVQWQLGKVVPKLKWDRKWDSLYQKFPLEEGSTYIGVQVSAETDYGLWRNWPIERWSELFQLLGANSNRKVILFGFQKTPPFNHPMILDLRGKTTLFEMLSIIKNRCSHLVLPDSGILSMSYYLDEPFPIEILSLWADPNHGILKQNVPSPNPLLIHRHFVAPNKDLSRVEAKDIFYALCPEKGPFTPWTKCYKSSEVELKERGFVGVLILAGGQGSRLDHNGPKGLFLIGGETLFERIVKKIAPDVPIAIMTSPFNHEETVDYFQKQENFGRQLFFFQQTTLPFLDESKQVIGLRGPDGNGSFYRQFIQSGVFEKMERLGVDLLTVIPVDNPLADPVDRALISHHRNMGAEVTIRCVERRFPEESMGVLIDRGGKLEILEYCDIDPEELKLKEVSGRLKYLYGYTGLIALSFPFIQRAAQIDLPLHWVKKEILTGTGGKRGIWKGERFLFDAFKEAKAITALCSPREECYAPLKRREGVNGIEDVERALAIK